MLGWGGFEPRRHETFSSLGHMFNCAHPASVPMAGKRQRDRRGRACLKGCRQHADIGAVIQDKVYPLTPLLSSNVMWSLSLFRPGPASLLGEVPSARGWLQNFQLKEPTLVKFGGCVVGSATMLREIVAFTRPAQASAAISSDPFRIPTRPPNSTCWDEVDLNHDGTKPSHPLDTCSIVPTPPPSQWQESAKGIGGDAPALRAAGNMLTLELLSRIKCTLWQLRHTPCSARPFRRQLEVRHLLWGGPS